MKNSLRVSSIPDKHMEFHISIFNELLRHMYINLSIDVDRRNPPTLPQKNYLDLNDLKNDPKTKREDASLRRHHWSCLYIHQFNLLYDLQLNPRKF